VSTTSTTLYGWPLVPSTNWPGETAVACPKCLSTNVTLTVRYGRNVSGYNRPGRLGDPGGCSLAICNDCGEKKEY